MRGFISCWKSRVLAASIIKSQNIFLHDTIQKHIRHKNDTAHSIQLNAVCLPGLKACKSNKN